MISFDVANPMRIPQVQLGDFLPPITHRFTETSVDELVMVNPSWIPAIGFPKIGRMVLECFQSSSPQERFLMKLPNEQGYTLQTMWRPRGFTGQNVLGMAADHVMPLAVSALWG